MTQLTPANDPLHDLDDVVRRNEVKTRLTDREYEALQKVKRHLKLGSDAQAAREMIRFGLLGVSGRGSGTQTA